MINDIKLILRDRCSIEDNYNLSLIERLFYSFKAIIAIIFDLKEKNISEDGPKSETVTDRKEIAEAI